MSSFGNRVNETFTKRLTITIIIFLLNLSCRFDSMHLSQTTLEICFHILLTPQMIMCIMIWSWGRAQAQPRCECCA